MVLLSVDITTVVKILWLHGSIPLSCEIQYIVIASGWTVLWAPCTPLIDWPSPPMAPWRSDCKWSSSLRQHLQFKMVNNYWFKVMHCAAFTVDVCLLSSRNVFSVKCEVRFWLTFLISPICPTRVNVYPSIYPSCHTLPVLQLIFAFLAFFAPPPLCVCVCSNTRLCAFVCV